MKFAKLALVAAMGLSGITAAHAAEDQGHGTITFTGSIIDAPCSITNKSAEQTIDLGQVSDSALANQGESTPVPFTIDLENCSVATDAANTVQVTFNGAQDAVDGVKMLGLSGNAAGAGIVIADGSGPLDLGTASSATTLSAGPNQLGFTAYLKGESGASVTVVPGSFQSVANFSMSYQ
ncbi:fimbrial protein [Klebsiella aerogenes]|uniref:fimbrial protein n=1 Tax=Klebsiella aerogenes TaxID=548 RepID=UPI00351D2085